MESETIGKIADALAKAQGEMQNAAKDKDNPFFKSTYADLASVWDACRQPLAKNGLAVVQLLNMPEPGRLILTTKLIHSSGEWFGSQVPVVPVKQDPQGVGSAITYMRRFTLSALVGIAPAEKPTEDDVHDDDDDGNAASDVQKMKGPVIAPKVVDRNLVMKELLDLTELHKTPIDQVKEFVQSKFHVESVKNLNADQLIQVIAWVKALPF